MDKEYRKVRRTAYVTAVLSFLLAIVMLVAPIFLLIVNSSIRPVVRKQKIFNFVKKNYDIIVEACENRDSAALSAINGIKDVDFANGYVLVYCQGYGFASATQYYGFYYSQDNLPVAVSDGQILCCSSQLEKEGRGYQYIDPSYNIFYIEHIKGNIYFYEAIY